MKKVNWSLLCIVLLVLSILTCYGCTIHLKAKDFEFDAYKDTAYEVDGLGIFEDTNNPQ